MFSPFILYIFLWIIASMSIKKERLSISKFFYRHPTDIDFISYGNTFCEGLKNASTHH